MGWDGRVEGTGRCVCMCWYPVGGVMDCSVRSTPGWKTGLVGGGGLVCMVRRLECETVVVVVVVVWVA
jgi:hypothetical protein